MLYKGRSVEVISKKEVFGEEVAWIRVLENGEFLKVSFEDLKEEQSTMVGSPGTELEFAL